MRAHEGCAVRETIATPRAGRARLRAEPGRAAPHPGRGRRGATHAPARRCARARRAVRCARCARAGHRQLYAARRSRRQGLGAAFTVHYLRGPVERAGLATTLPRRVVSTPTCAHRLVRVPRRAGLNRLHENIVWSMRGNFLDVPTDCPQRDERLGWTGDLQVFAPTASFLYDCAGFLASWLRRPGRGADAGGDGAAVRAAGRLPRAVRFAGADGRVGRRGGDRAVGVSTSASATRACCGGSTRSMRAWVDGLTALWGPARCWTSRPCSSATGSTRPRRPTSRAAAATDPHLVATAFPAHVGGPARAERRGARRGGTPSTTTCGASGQAFAAST